jgi:hypothetical protein
MTDDERTVLWLRVEHLLHRCWGDAAAQLYDKPQWRELQAALEKLRLSEGDK